MSDERAGPVTPRTMEGDVRPNTLRDMSMPNTFRAQTTLAAAPGASRSAVSSGGPNLAMLRQLPRWVFAAAAALVLLLVLFLLNGPP